MITQLLPLPIFRAFTAGGIPLGGGLLYAYAAGTTTPQNTYSDVGGTQPNANPMPLDTTGSASIRLDPSLAYKFVLTDMNGAVQWTEDNYQTSNTNYQSTYGTVSASLASILASWESPANYGTYYGDGSHDDTATLNDFFAAANTNLNGAPNGWVNGIIPGSPLISSTVVIAGNSFTVWFGGQPTAAAGFTSGGTPYVNDCCFNVTASNVNLWNPSFDGNAVLATCKANGFAINGSRVRLHEVTGTHYPLYGVSFNTGYGDNHIYGHQLQQFENGDVPFLTQSNFTADGIRIANDDCSVEGGYSRWNKINIHVTSTAGTTWIKDIHTYNGNSGLSTTPNPFLDQINIQVDAGAVNIHIQNCYLDNGHIDLYSPFVTIRDCLFLQNSACNFSVDANGVPNYIRLYCNGNSAAYALDIDTSTFTLETTNAPNNTNPTAPFGHLPCPSLTATTAAASSTGTATINVAAWIGPQPAVGSDIIVAGVTPSGFNGTFQVTGSTSTSVSFANSTAGPQTVAGTIQCTWVGVWSAEAALFTNTGNDLEARPSTVKIWTREDSNIPEEQELKGLGTIQNTWRIGAGATNTDTKAVSSRVFSCPLGVNGNAAPAQVTGWGTPVGPSVISSYNITDAGGSNSNTNKAVAQIINDLKAFGIYGA